MPKGKTPVTGVKRSAVVNIRFTPDEFKNLKDRSEKKGMNVSDYIRYVLEEAKCSLD